MQLNDFVYTDIAFETIRNRYTRRSLEIAMLLLALNGLWWAYFAYLFSAWPMVAVDIFGACAAIAILLISTTLKNVSGMAIAHLGMVVCIAFIWAFILVVEGLPAGRFPTLNHWWFVVCGLSACLYFVNSTYWRAIYLVIALISFVVCDQGILLVPAYGPLPTEAASVMFSTMENGVHVGVFICVMLLAGVFVTNIVQAQEQLSRVNSTLESLLGNMLPRAIADRLRREGKTFADGYAECSVLFVDIVGFTALTKRMQPEQLVRLLDEIFSKFDLMTDELRLEKIKTIGDSYMVAAGLPEARSDHATACVALAFKLREAIREYAGLSVRIGINSGSVVAGVIGKKKFIYDLWGDTVNIASRMESHGVANEIQITAHTAELIKNEYLVKPRGEIRIKGHGPLPVFLVEGKHIFHPDRNHHEAELSFNESAQSVRL